jgi:predicted transcriptional regulator
MRSPGSSFLKRINMKLFKEEKVQRKVYIATDLRKYREEKNIGLRELSRKLNLAPATISAIEVGKHSTTKKTAEFIEKYLLSL